MKKLVCLILCVCLAFCLSVSSFAAIDPDAYWYPNSDGTYGFDTVGYNFDYAADLIATSGVNLNAEDYWAIDEHGTYYYDIDRFNVDYDAAIAALNAVSEPVPDPYPVEWPDEVIEDDTSGIVNESENDPVSDILEDGQINTELELGENLPMVYSVYDLRSSASTLSTSPLTAQDIWGYHKIKALGRTYKSPAGVYFLQGLVWKDGSFYEVNDRGNETSIEHEINIDGQYAYFPSKNVYVDHHFVLWDEVPSSTDITSYVDLWFPMGSKPTIYGVDTAVGVVDISLQKVTSGGIEYMKFKYKLLSEVVYNSDEITCEVDLERRLAYFPTLNIWMDEYWQIYDTEPVDDSITPPDDGNVDDGNGDVTGGDDGLIGGLKSLIISIFGEYTPVNTTMAITETVDNTVTTTLVDAVASGAAGVDYEWLAGVFLFGIMLYCLFKLLGGILS